MTPSTSTLPSRSLTARTSDRHRDSVSTRSPLPQPGRWRLGQTSPAIAGGEVIYPPDTDMPARRQVVRVNELIALLDRVRGVDYVEEVTINGAAADHELPDVQTLPQAGSLTGVAHGGNPPAPAPSLAQLAVEGVA